MPKSRAKGVSHKAPCSDDDLAPVAGAPKRPIRPWCENRDLHRAFARLPTADPDAIRAFADRFGNLGPGRVACREWVGEILELRELLDLWDRGVAGASALETVVHWSDDGSKVTFRPATPGAAPEPQLIAARGGRRGEWMARFTPGELFLPALAFLQCRLNEELDRSAKPALVWHPDTGTLVPGVRPTTLRAWLWARFAHEVGDRFAFRACGGCDRWFQITPELARTNRRTCSRACQNRVFRARQSQARDWAANGKSVAEIASALDTSEPTVAGWLGGESPGDE